MHATAETQATAITLQATQQARRCDDPQQVAVNASLRLEEYRLVQSFTAYAGGTARNTCNFQIRVSLQFAGLAADGRVVATSVPLRRTLAPGEEIAFSQILGTLNNKDRVTALKAIPTVVE